MIEKILAARHWLAECVGDRLAHGEHVIHCAYLGLVFHEGHGLYAMVAGGGFVVVLLHLVIVGLADE